MKFKWTRSIPKRALVKRTNIKPQVDMYTFPDGHSIFRCWRKAVW